MDIFDGEHHLTVQMLWILFLKVSYKASTENQRLPCKRRKVVSRAMYMHKNLLSTEKYCLTEIETQPKLYFKLVYICSHDWRPTQNLPSFFY